ncbi:hypothetical protein BU17DRAFT_103300 [Hysterangium stoloniferum]|nr:hypothetical protein BU17DRAFT_103300 [Hysterangium stoloniferum]
MRFNLHWGARKRFDREIDIGKTNSTYPPDSPSSVLLSKMPHSFTPTDLESLAFRTNGYVGADLGVPSSATHAPSE